MFEIFKRNNALTTNPTNNAYPLYSQINITEHGSNLYWAIMSVMAASTLGFIALSFKVDRKSRVFHYITASITMVATISYFTMASNLGYAAVPVEFQRGNPRVAGIAREIFYVRYVDWAITTPLLLTDLLLTAGMPWSTILYTVLIDEVMITSGLVGALVESRYKWGYFVFAVASLVFITYNIVWVARENAALIGKEVHKTFTFCGVWTMFIWVLYPVAWGLSEGGNVIAPDSEAIFYGVLDILAKPVFGAMLLYGHSTFDINILGLNDRKRYRVAGGDESNDAEKGDASNRQDVPTLNEPQNETAQEDQNIQNRSRSHSASSQRPSQRSNQSVTNAPPSSVSFRHESGEPAATGLHPPPPPRQDFLAPQARSTRARSIQSAPSQGNTANIDDAQARQRAQMVADLSAARAELHDGQTLEQAEYA